MAPLLVMKDIRKSFLGVEVLHGVGLECEAGEIHAVMGENGAGKSTLMKVLAGVYSPDGGTIELEGQPVSFHHPVQAQAAGIAIIFQEFNLLPDRTVAENVFVNREPTAALAEHEVEVLFTLLRRLRERGLGMVYISHRLREIFTICNRITVLKDGEFVGTVPTEGTDTNKLISMMVGRELDGYFPPRGTAEELGDVRLSAKGISTSLLKDISLDVRAGEIVGLAGLQGSGRTELARALFGADPLRSGTVEVDGKTRGRGPRSGIRAGMGFITEDRKLEGLALAPPIRDNVMLAVPSFGRSRRAKLSNTVSVQELARSVELKARSL